MDMPSPCLVGLALGWLAYFAFHSLLASLAVKRQVARRWPGAMPLYRLTYNILAATLILPLLYFSLTGEGGWLWRWQGAGGWLADALALAALGGFLWTLRYYSSGAFLGLEQWRRGEQTVEDSEGFHISPLHRHVRHPWYALGLLVIWTRDMDPARLTAALCITAYLFLGSRLEERKLMRFHGEAYRHYRRRVPGILPLPWKRLSPEEARSIEAMARRERP